MISEAHLMDCMVFMKSLPDNYITLAVCDPPYGIGQPKQSNLKGYNGRKSLEDRIQKNRLNGGSGKLKNRTLNTSNCEWDNAIPTDKYFAELKRISQNQIIWGGNYFPLPPTRCVICWDKVQPWENFSQVEIAWTSFDSPARLFKFDNRTGGKIHPTAKPITLYSWIYANYLPQGGRVFDSHAGSNSNRIAADMAGNIDYYSTEIDPDYFNSAETRWQNYKAQTVLTFPESKIIEQIKLF